MFKKAMHTIRVIILLIALQSCNSNRTFDQVKLDTLKTLKTSILPTAEANDTFDTLSVAKGDLNFDNIADLVVALKKNGEDIVDLPPKRPLRILFGNKDHSYSLICSSENVVLTYGMAGTRGQEPFAKMAIEKGLLRITHYGGMFSYHWEQTVSFKFSIKDKIFYVDRIEKEEEKISDNTLQSFNEKKKVKTAKDFGLLPFGKYNVFDNIKQIVHGAW